MTQLPKHTPAPWYVHDLGRHWNNPKIDDIAVCYGNDDEHICDTVYNIHDAHLIAAAPELLEALEYAIKNSPMGEDTYEIFKSIALNAIAKAKGE